MPTYRVQQKGGKSYLQLEQQKTEQWDRAGCRQDQRKSLFTLSSKVEQAGTILSTGTNLSTSIGKRATRHYTKYCLLQLLKYIQHTCSFRNNWTAFSITSLFIYFLIYLKHIQTNTLVCLWQGVNCQLSNLCCGLVTGTTFHKQHTSQQFLHKPIACRFMTIHKVWGNTNYHERSLSSSCEFHTTHHVPLNVLCIMSLVRWKSKKALISLRSFILVNSM
jgi:hypothetical protein